VQETFGNRPRECGRAHRKGEQDQGGGHSEGEPRGKATQQAIAAENTEGKADLAGGWPGKELTERNQVGIGRLVEPFASHDQFIAEIAEMGDGPAERRQAQLQECAEDFTGAPLGSVTAHGRAPATGLGPEAG
jgi:hypothetical protein